MKRDGGWWTRIRGRGLWVWVALGGLVLAFFHKLALSNLILARGDTFLYFYPYWRAAADALRAGRVPLWNPDLFMGAPFLANSQAGFFYPLNWPVWLLFSTPYAVSASILLHLVIAGGGAYLAGRRTLALGRPAALFGAALFALGGYLSAQVEHVNQLQGLAWLPWLFVAVAPLVRPDTGHPPSRFTVLSAALAVGALFALQLLAGHTQTAFISGVAVVVWLAAQMGRPIRSRVGRVAAVLAGGVALAAVLAAVQLLPTLELTGLSSRQGGLPINEVLSFSWSPLHLTRALLPAYGQTLFSEYVVYLPLTALALAFVGGWAWRRDAAARPWLLLIAVALVLALGRYTPLYHLLGRLPAFELFRVPARWLAVAALGVALLAGAGWQRLALFAAAEWPTAEARAAARRELTRPLWAAAVALGLLLVWGFAAVLLARVLPAGAEAPFQLPTGRDLLGWFIEAVLAGLLLGVILTGPRERVRHAPYELALLALVALWLGTRGLPYNQLTTPQAYFELRPPAARLRALAGCVAPGPCADPPGRFLSLSDIFFDPGDTTEIESIYGDQLSDAALYDYIVAVKHKEVLSPNLSLLDGLPAIDGFDGGILPLAAYGELMRLILPAGAATTDGRLREYLSAAPDARWLSLFNGRYLITDKTGDVWREGVFFDRQHRVSVEASPARVETIPFEATELWLLSDGTPPPIEIATEDGQRWALTAEQIAAPDLYRVAWPEPAIATDIALLPCESAGPCGLAALTLVDARDDTFQPLTPAPYRLIHSGDVKIYENRDALPRAYMVYDWQWQPDGAAAVTALGAAGFDPATTAVLVGGDAGQSPPGEGRGTVDVTAYAPERVTLTTDGDAGLLLLTDAYYPGWRATVNGAPATIYRADGLFRGVFVPAGQHEVVFEFRPRSFALGAAVSLAGLVLVAVALLAYRMRR